MKLRILNVASVGSNLTIHQRSSEDLSVDHVLSAGANLSGQGSYNFPPYWGPEPHLTFVKRSKHQLPRKPDVISEKN